MFGFRFLGRRPSAIADTVEQVRRLHELRRMLAEFRRPLPSPTAEWPNSNVGSFHGLPSTVRMTS